jgi:uncharacterized protein
MMRIWRQLRTTDVFSNALFCLWLSIASVLQSACVTIPARQQVLPALRGDYFPLLAPTHLFHQNDEQLPEAILVGISYGSFDPAINKRNVDFSAPGSDARPGEDGAPQFLSFLKGQLIPEVERRYKANPQRRVLVGQSRSGFFVLWSAVQDPGLFWASIASKAAVTDH